MFGEIRKYLIHYYLVDDSVEIRECHQPNDGRDPFPVLLRRGKLPKSRYDVDNAFPMAVMELTEHEVTELVGVGKMSGFFWKIQLTLPYFLNLSHGSFPPISESVSPSSSTVENF